MRQGAAPQLAEEHSEVCSRSGDLAEMLQKRAKRQRRWLIVGALWVLVWASLFGNDLLRYNVWPYHPIWYCAVFDLIVSPFALAMFFMPAALIGRALGSVPKLRPARYPLILGLPVLLALGMQVPTALDRIQPERRFERLAGVAFPAEAVLLDYRSISAGMDYAVEFEFRASDDVLEQLADDLDWGPGNRTGSIEVLQPEQESGDFRKLTIDWSLGSAVFEYVDV